MIYSITGKVSMQNENTIIVDTGAIAYEVICSSFAAYSLSSKPEPQTILTYLQVKEDAMCLFGFSSKKEKMLFNDIMLVSGVGPKMAITVLSGLPLDELVKAIVSSDIKTLSSVKGLGKKTAERIVLELNGKFGGTEALENLISSENLSTINSTALRKEMQEAVEVLVSTGVSKNDAVNMAKEHFKEGMTSEQLVIVCFKNLR